MSRLGIVGIVLVVLGLGVLAYQEVAFATHEEVLRVGPAGFPDRERAMLVPPILGALAVGSGLMLLIAGPRR
jgi:hypothetical protein